MNHLERDQLVVILLDGGTEVQTGVSASGAALAARAHHAPLVDDLQIAVLQKRAHLRLACEYLGDELSNNTLLLCFRYGRVPFLQTQLALSTEQQQIVHHFYGPIVDCACD